jgi:hypothetical protein
MEAAMPRARKLSDHSYSPEAALELSRRRRESLPLQSVAAPSSEPDSRRWEFNIADAIAEMLFRGDGWLRCTAPLDGRSMYVFFKFSIGRWAGHYVVVRVGRTQFERALQLLLQKISLVDSGQLSPSRDRDPRFLPEK